MREQGPNPLGKLLGGVSVIALSTQLQRWVVDDPVVSGSEVFLLLCGLWILASGLLDLVRTLWIMSARRKAQRPTGMFGDAKLADLQDCADAGLTNPHGLFLGCLGGVPLFFNGKAHLITVAPARKGKGVTVVVPNLLHYQGSVFVTDPKGELAAITSRHRQERFRQRIIFLNPWKLHGLPNHRYNPLHTLVLMFGDPRRWGELGDAARSLALQLIPEPAGGDRNQYFRDAARNLLEGLILYLVTRGKPERCTLPELWRIVKNSELLEMAFRAMAESDALDGVVAAYGREFLSQFEEGSRQFVDFRTGVSNALQIFRPGGALADAVSETDIDLSSLKAEATTVYVMIPAERIADYGVWLALISRQAISAATVQDTKRPVLFMLDEFANMGRIAGIAEALTLLPGYGVRVWTIVQDLSHLAQVYGRETADIILSQSEVKQFFGVQDQELAARLSRFLGERSVITRSFNLGPRFNDEVSVSVSERGLPLLLPQNISGMSSDRQLLLVNNAPPIMAEKTAYWSVTPWRDWADENPMEGDHPRAGRPVVRMRYASKGGVHE